MAQTVIGLDIGTWSIKAAVLESTLRGFSLVDFREHHRPRGPEGELVESDLDAPIAAVLRGLKDRGAIVTAVNGLHTMLREIELPFKDARKIESVLAFQLDGSLPQPIEQMVYDYYVLEDEVEGGGSRLLCAAVMRDYLGEFLGELKHAGADPKLVEFDAIAAAKLVPRLDMGAPGQAVALVDVGHETTTISLVRDSKVEGVRTLARGGHQLTMALAKGLGVDYATAERIKHEEVRLDGLKPADVDEETARLRLEMIARPIRAMVRDIATTLHAHGNRGGRGEVAGAYLYGGTTRLPGLREALSDALDLPVATPHATRAEWSKVPADHAVDMVIPKAAALALRFIDDDADTTLNFRQEELAFESDFKALRDRAAALAMLVAAIILVFFVRQYAYLGSLEDNHQALVTQLEGYSERILGEPRDNFEAVLQRVSKPPEESKEQVFPEMTAFKAFFQVTDAQEAVNELGKTQASSGGAGGDRSGDVEDDDDGAGPGFRQKATPSLPPGPKEIAPPDRSGGADGESGEEEEEERDDSFKVELRQVQIDLKTAFVKGEASNIGAVVAFNEELAKNVCFRNVETAKTDRTSFGNRQNWLRFDIRMDVQCSEPDEDDKGK